MPEPLDPELERTISALEAGPPEGSARCRQLVLDRDARHGRHPDPGAQTRPVPMGRSANLWIGIRG
jgi:hypothetical protein